MLAALLLFIYIYIYIHTHINMIYIYIYRHVWKYTAILKVLRGGVSYITSGSLGGGFGCLNLILLSSARSHHGWSIPNSTSIFLNVLYRVNTLSPPTSVLDMTLNHLMLRLLFWNFKECGVPLHCHYSQLVPVWISSMGQIEPFNHFYTWNHLTLYKQMISIQQNY